MRVFAAHIEVAALQPAVAEEPQADPARLCLARHFGGDVLQDVVRLAPERGELGEDLLPGEALRVLRALAVLALVASTTHLGRPRYAFRALLNLRRSWLSREVLVFGAFGASALLAAGTVVFRSPHASVAAHLALVTGLLGVGASVMVYAVTGRAWWSPGRTAFRFFGTTAVLGTWSLALAEASAARPAEHLLALAAALTLGKLAGEATDFAPRRHGAVARGAALLRGALRHRTAGRFLLPTVFAGLAPLAVLGAGLSATPLAIVAGLGFVAAFSGEVLERRSFFAAESAARMPGAIGGGR